ncbi:MAG: enoyl-CoA hydratase [Alphaproteobacteria bacterium]|nr:enoyl-CoA hydratase [Alphaproteobacteria bacterium]
MAYSEILYETKDRVAVMTLNRPDKLNAWTETIEAELRHAMDAAMEDDGVRVAVLTGAGRGFCAGYDMKLLAGIQGSGGRQAPSEAWKRPYDMDRAADFQTRYGYFPSLPKPVIGAINGPVAGLGLVVALYCDLRFAADSAVFATAFSRRGLIAEYGISWTLPRLVGPARAFDLLVSSRKVDAAEALRIGLADRVYPAERLMAETLAYARELAEMVSPRSMATIKRQLWEVDNLTLAEATRIANAEMHASFKSEDFREGVAHFVEKRPPRFSGK